MLHRNREKAIQSIVDYVEGRMPINVFREEFLTNSNLQKVLKEPMDQKYEYLKDYDFQLYNLFMNGYIYKKSNWNTVRIKFGLQAELEEFLDQQNIIYKKFTKYDDAYSFILDIQPSWVFCVDDQGIYDKILEEVPKDISKTKQIAWGKARIKELFRYEKTYPRWVQSPEWPIVNGKPLVFSHQSKEKKDDERVYYNFYDPETKEETVVMQLY